MTSPEHKGQQFAGIVESKSPLDYKHGYPVRRLEVLHPDAPEPNENYFAPTERKQRNSPTTGRPYKTPKVTVEPGAHPKAVSFLDYHHDGRDTYIDYMKTRNDYAGQGHAQRLVDAVYGRAAKAEQSVNFGEVMHPAAGHIYEKKRKQAEAGKTLPTYGKDRYS